jgi:acyl-lipid omega-6 desaturase (Delta-12 desaturase)
MGNSRRIAKFPKGEATTLQSRLSVFQRPSAARSVWQLCNTLIPFFAIWGLAWWVLSYSFWLALPLIMLNSGFLVRTFIIFHDCGHQAFFRSRRANTIWGRITGVITLTPYYYWHASHARHHATSANLDKRGFGDVWMMTVNEYLEATKTERLKYRLYRQPLVMFILGPMLIFLVSHRTVRRGSNKREKNSVYLTNLAILTCAVGASLVLGVWPFVIIQSLILFFGLSAGVWLFYVQHQFEGVYWEREGDWDFVTASLDGGSFYQLPWVLKWFTGNIGYHHVHHLNPRIPNYNLPKCHRDIPALQATKPVRLFSSLKSLQFRLWDEERGVMVGFRAVKEARRLTSSRS